MRRLHRALQRHRHALLHDADLIGTGRRDHHRRRAFTDGTHALQLAWKELDVPQCGYCQAGQLMSAAALLAKNPKPTDKDIDDAMNENLCRCATYLRIRQAIHRAAEIKAGGAAAAKASAEKGRQL